jgi:hypothetical protein
MSVQSDPLHLGIMAFMSEEEYYTENATGLFSSWTNASNIDDAALRVAIMDQPSCKSAQMNRASYACGGTDTVCRNASQGGYTCYCSNYNYYYGTDTNPYLSEGCRQGVGCLLSSIKFQNINSNCLLVLTLTIYCIMEQIITTLSLKSIARGHVET